MGAANPADAPNNILENRYEADGCPGNLVAVLDYETPDAWASFWIGLGEADLTSYDTLTFLAKGGPEQGIPPEFKVELKREGGAQVGVLYLAGLTDTWQQFSVALESFRPPEGLQPLCGWDAMNELVFTFEAKHSGPKGRVYLDDVYVEQRGKGAPSPPPDCGPATPAGLVVADFDNCEGLNNLGGLMGAACATNKCVSPNRLAEYYVGEADRGCVAKLEYGIEAWSAFWMKLEGADLTPYRILAFDVRAEPEWGIPGHIKIELKRDCHLEDYVTKCNEVSIYYVSGIEDRWRRIYVLLDYFVHTGWPDVGALSSYVDMHELVFVFEAGPSGRHGVVFLDNITFEP